MILIIWKLLFKHLEKNSKKIKEKIKKQLRTNVTREERGYNYPLFCYIRRRLDRKKEE